MLILRDWRRFVWWPGILFAVALAVLIGGKFDRAIANALFHDVSTGWLGAGAGDWWAHGIIHSAGRWLVRGVAFAALVAWGASFVLPGLKPWRREIAFIVVGMFAVILVTGILKRMTNVDCPWALEGFGGTRPYAAARGVFSRGTFRVGIRVAGVLLRVARPRAPPRRVDVVVFDEGEQYARFLVRASHR